MWHDNHDLLLREIQAVGDSFPTFCFYREATDDAPYGHWEGRLKTDFGNLYEIDIRYPKGFPWKAPKAFVVEPRIFVSPHRWGDGSLCLFGSDEEWRFTSAAPVITQTAVWLFCQEHWELTGGFERYEETGDIRSTWEFWPTEQELH